MRESRIKLRRLQCALAVAERGRRGAVPTAEGEQFLRHAGISVSARRSGLDGIAAKARGAESLARVPVSTAGTEEPSGIMLRADTEPGVALRALIACIREETQARTASR